ncbi:helix-turn-helix transcriptional regulator [Candidatus Puniceispirillum sp.]|uniref:helix-turn-helix transcriptional regulator n=1 Tax=Candidatus Puniceispirillum sp. TaxID=2026719 RepID=UPI003F697A5D
MTKQSEPIQRSLTQYVNELRLNHARALLMDTNDKIVSIALDSGFGSLSQFYSLFRKQFGVTPRPIKIEHGGNISYWNTD